MGNAKYDDINIKQIKSYIRARVLLEDALPALDMAWQEQVKHSLLSVEVCLEKASKEYYAGRLVSSRQWVDDARGYLAKALADYAEALEEKDANK